MADDLIGLITFARYADKLSPPTMTRGVGRRLSAAWSPSSAPTKTAPLTATRLRWPAPASINWAVGSPPTGKASPIVRAAIAAKSSCF